MTLIEEGGKFYLVNPITGTKSNAFNSAQEALDAAESAGLKVTNADEFQTSTSSGGTWRVPSGRWKGITWPDLLKRLKSGAATLDEVAAIIQESTPPYGEGVILDDVKSNLPEGVTLEGPSQIKPPGYTGDQDTDKRFQIPPDASVPATVNGVKEGLWDAQTAYYRLLQLGMTDQQAANEFRIRGIEPPTPSQGAPGATGTASGGAGTGGSVSGGGGAATPTISKEERQRQALDAARAQYESQGFKVFSNANGTLRVETLDNHVFNAGVDANGQVVTDAPKIRQTGLGGSNSPESMMAILNNPKLSPDVGEAYKTLAPTRPTTDALFNALLFNRTQENYQTAPGNQKVTYEDLIAKGMTPDQARQTIELRAIADRNATAQAQELMTKLNSGQGAAPSTSTNPTAPVGGFQVTGNKVLNRFGQEVDENGDPITDEDMYAPSAFADNPNSQLSRVLSLSRAAFGEGGTVKMGDHMGMQQKNGRPALTLNEPASVIGDITGKRYAMIGETGMRETLMPGPNGMRVEPTNRPIGMADGGTVQAGSGLTVTGTLPDGSILITNSLGRQQVITPEGFALLSLDQRNEIERQVQQMAMNQQNQTTQDQQAAEQQQLQNQAAEGARQNAQRDELNAQQRILDAQLQEYEQGTTGLDTRAALAGVQAPLTQSQYLQNFTLPQVQLRGGQSVLNAQGVPQRFGSKIFPLLGQNASGQTSTLGRSLRQQYRATSPTSRTRPSLLRLQVR